MALQIQKMKDTRSSLNIMIYGEAGVGKTVLAASAEELGKVLFLDVEGGTLSIRHRWPDMDVAPVTCKDDITEAYSLLASPDTEYTAVVIDSLTELRKLLITEAVGDAIEADDEHDPDIASLRDYLRVLEQMRRIVRGYRDLKVSTIFTALSLVDKDQKTGKRSVMPALGESAGREIPGYLDIVGYMYKQDVDGEVKRLLLTAHVGKEIAKDRTDRLPEVMEDPTMHEIWTLVTATGEQ